MRTLSLTVIALLVGFASAGEKSKSSARPLPGWVEKLHQEHYLGYKFELPKTVKKKHPRLPYPSAKVLKYYKENLARVQKEQPKLARDPLIMYVITKDKKYFDQVVKGIGKVRAGKFQWSGGGGRSQMTFRLAYALDWLYDELPADVRKICAQKCVAASKKGLQGGQGDLAPTQTFFMNRCGLSGMAEAIAAWGEVPEAEEQLKWAHRRFFRDFLPLWQVAMGRDGGGLSVPSYRYIHSFQSNIVGGFETWGSFLGQNLYEKHPWMKAFGYQPLFLTMPNLVADPLGDCSSERVGARPYNMHGEVFAERYDDAYLRHLAYRFRPGNKPPGHQVFKPTEYGYWHQFDPSGKKMLPPEKGLPAERFFGGGWGLVAMRSDWTEGATYALFKIGDVTTNHTHCDSGMFFIYKHGDLALDSGLYSPGSHHGKNYNGLAIAHNVVTVRDPADKFVPNEGGQRAVASSYHGSPRGLGDFVKRREVYETGDMLAYDPHPEYVYAAGDLTPAYQCALTGKDKKHRHRTRRLEKMTRAFLYIRPDYFAVFDRVAALKPEFQKRWLLHTSHQPKVTGNIIEVERNDTLDTKTGRKYCPWASPMFIQAMKRGKSGRPGPECYRYKYHGKLFCKTLLPKKHKITLVGGPGKEFWADGKNHDIVHHIGGKYNSAKLTGDPTLARAVGAWRAEVSPAENTNKQDLFLHVIQVGDSGKLKKMVPVDYLEAAGKVGFKMTAEGRTYTVLFDRSGIGGHISIVKDGKKLIDRDFATGIGKNRKP